MPGKRDQREVTRPFSVIGIMASPRKGGNSDRLLDKALEGARSAGASVEKIVLNDLDFKACQGCGGCGRTGICKRRDDMRPVYKKLEASDAVIIASPVFFGTISAQLKMMIDRFHCIWVKKHILKLPPPRKKKRRGVFLCISASDRKEFFENSRKLVRIFFATLDIEYFGEVFCAGADKAGAIKAHKEALDKAFRLGERLASYGKQV